MLDCNEVIPDRLWIGGFVRPEDAPWLRRMGITTIVNLQSDDDLRERGVSLKKLVKALSEADIELRRAPIMDFNKQNIAANLYKCVAELESALSQKWTRVYLHCTAGFNRAPTTAAAYLVKTKGMTAKQACEFVMGKRHCMPYLDVLEIYESTLPAES
jgi:protein-tyrosine phosphatase